MTTASATPAKGPPSAPTSAAPDASAWGLRHVAHLFDGRWKLVAAFVLSALGRTASQVAVLLLIQSFLSGVLGGEAAPGSLTARVAGSLGTGGVLWAGGLLLLLVQIAGSLSAYVNYVAQQHINKVVELGTMELLIRHLLKLSVPFFDRQSHGDVIETVLTDVGHLRTMVRSMFNILFEGLLAVGLVATVIKISPELSLLALVVVPAAALPLYVIANRTLKRAFHVRETGFVLSDIILQVLRGIRVIKIFRAEEAQARESVEKGTVFHEAMISRIQTERLASVVMDIISGLLVVVVIVIGGRKVMLGELPWAGLLAFILAVRGLFGPINNMSTYYVDLQVTKPAVQRIATFLRTPPDIVDRPGAGKLDKPPGEIVFDEVSFTYGHEQVLKRVSFAVRAGETIGIVSPSGGGKSTLLSLLVRFYDPTSGGIRFDGKDLRDVRIADLYAQMTMVTQDSFIFSTTVRENIRYGRPSATDAEVEDAARAAYVHDEITALPQGYETAIGMGGRDLSGGQKQRVSIARALLKNAPLLLLDEATSALDSVAEAEVQRAVERLMLGRTSFVVAHRLSTLRNADRVLVLDRGERVGYAPHEQLLDECPLYRKLWQTQVATAMGGSGQPAAPGEPGEEAPAARSAGTPDLTPA
jgi:ATP-binding cassette, subfamily B, bacterial MsbA